MARTYPGSLDTVFHEVQTHQAEERLAIFIFTIQAHVTRLFRNITKQYILVTTCLQKEILEFFMMSLR